MNAHRYILISALSFQALALFLQPALANIITYPGNTAPSVLGPGTAVNPIPNGYSFLGGVGWSEPIPATSYSFEFGGGGPAGTLIESIYQFSGAGLPDAGHPYGGGLMFDFVISLTASSVAQFSVFGYAGYDTSIKQCDFTNCIVEAGSPTIVAATSASRTAGGNGIDFSFSNLIAGTDSSDFQIFTNAANFADPPALFTDANGDTFSLDINGPTQAVPEPPAWTMIILGFGLIGFMAYRRKARLALIAA